MTDDDPVIELEDLLVRPGTYFNPQTEVVVVVDDSISIDQEVFNLEAYEGADWVRVADEVPVDSDALDTAMERFQSQRHAPVGVSTGSDGAGTRLRRSRGGRTGARAGPGSRRADDQKGAAMSHSIANRNEAVDWMADFPGFGEMRHYTEALGTEQVSFSWRLMPPGTGGRGSYGHRHPGQEEVYFVISGTITFKVGNDVFEAGPQTAVRMGGDEFYSVHNDTQADAELLIFSTLLADAPVERQDDFWPQ